MPIRLKHRKLNIRLKKVDAYAPPVEPVAYELALEKEGEGVISPSEGVYSINSGTTQQLMAAPLAGNEFVKWSVVDDGDYDEPVIDLLMDGNKAAKAFFEEIIIFLTIQDVFSTEAVNNIFEDLTEYNNNIEIVDSPCGKFNGLDNYIITKDDAIDLNQPNWFLEIEPNSVNTANRVILSHRDVIFGGSFFNIYVLTTTNLLTVRVDGSGVDLNIDGIENPIIKCERVDNTLEVFLNNVSKGTIDIAGKTFVTGIPTILGGQRVHYAVPVEAFYDGNLNYLNFNNQYVLNFEEQTGDDLYNSASVEIPDKILGTNITAFRSGVKNSELRAYTKGFSINTGVIIPALIDGVLDSQGNAIQFAKGSGIINGLSSEYIIPIDTDLNEVIPSGQYTWQQLRDLATSEFLEKTEDNEKITRMIVKKKSNAEISTIENSTVINDNTIII